MERRGGKRNIHENINKKEENNWKIRGCEKVEKMGMER